MIAGDDIDNILYLTSKTLLESTETYPRGLKTKEITNYTSTLKNPDRCIITNPGRNLSLDYLKAEFDWYKSGDRNIKNIKDHASMWERIANENGDVNSNYGFIVYKEHPVNFPGTQFDWVVESLTKDKDSRQALINFNSKEHKYRRNKDFVCTTSTQYFIRDDKLQTTTNMRSNDLIYGFSYDMPFFYYIQQDILNNLKGTYPDLQLGEMTHNVASMHVYEKHFDMLDKIVKSYEDNPSHSQELKDIIDYTQ